MMRMGTLGEQNGISGKETHGWCQSVPIGNAGHHGSTCTKLQPKQLLIFISENSLNNTYQGIPFLNIIYGINSNTKVFSEYKDFNPME